MWTRPENGSFPSIWLTFKAKDIETDNLVEYRVQDLPEEYYEEALNQMVNIFVKDEALCGTIGLFDDKVSVKEILEMWRELLKQRVVLACFRENSKDLVGVNMVYVVTKDEHDNYEEKINGEKWKIVYKLVKMVSGGFDVFDHYKVDKYLSALGLSVDPKYRGRGIAQQILKARVPLCKAMNIPLTSTVFTGSTSQHCAGKVGFEDNFAISYEEFTKMGYDYSKCTTKYCKLMSLKV